MTERRFNELTDAEWEQLVVDLRETFDARGSIRQEGSFRQFRSNRRTRSGEARFDSTCGLASDQAQCLVAVREPLSLLRLVGLAAMLLLGGGCPLDWAEPEVYLIPNGYEGPVLVIFGDSSGAPERRNGADRVYQIPAGGVLRTRFRPNPGWGAPRFYYVDATGRRTQIGQARVCTDAAVPNVVRVCQMPTISVMGRRAPEYASYVVGRDPSELAVQTHWEKLVLREVFGEQPPVGGAGRPGAARDPR